MYSSFVHRLNMIYINLHGLLLNLSVRITRWLPIRIIEFTDYHIRQSFNYRSSLNHHQATLNRKIAKKSSIRLWSNIKDTQRKTYSGRLVQFIQVRWLTVSLNQPVNKTLLEEEPKTGDAMPLVKSHLEFPMKWLWWNLRIWRSESLPCMKFARKASLGRYKTSIKEALRSRNPTARQQAI